MAGVVGRARRCPRAPPRWHTAVRDVVGARRARDLQDEWPPPDIEALLADLRWYRWDPRAPGGWRSQLAIEDESEELAWSQRPRRGVNQRSRSRLLGDVSGGEWSRWRLARSGLQRHVRRAVRRCERDRAGQQRAAGPSGRATIAAGDATRQNRGHRRRASRRSRIEHHPPPARPVGQHQPARRYLVRSRNAPRRATEDRLDRTVALLDRYRRTRSRGVRRAAIPWSAGARDPWHDVCEGP